MRGNHIQQVSTDHTWVQEAIEKGILTPEQARDHPNVHVIRRYLGAPQPSEVDFRLRLEKGENDSQAEKNQGARLLPGDKLLLCSDGLTDLVKEDEILQAIRRAADKHNKGLGALVDLANQRGGHDNITVVLLAVPDDGQKPKKKKSRSLIPWLFGGLFVLLALAALAAWLVFDFQIPVIFPTPTSPTSQTAQTAQPAPPLLFSSPTAAQATPVPPTATWTPLPTETPSATFESGPTYTPWPTNTP
jgi:protein phosphatase